MSKGEIYRRLDRIERDRCALEALFGPLAARSRQTVAGLIAEEATAIYRDALGCGFTGLELAAIRCRCNVARLALIPARPGSPVAVSIASERRILARIEHAIARADAELAEWVMVRLEARGWPARFITRPTTDP